jgi:hypothetical protein
MSFIEYKSDLKTLEKGDNDIQSVSNIYWRAKKQLDDDLVEQFTQQFCLLKIKATKEIDNQILENVEIE